MIRRLGACWRLKSDSRKSRKYCDTLRLSSFSVSGITELSGSAKRPYAVRPLVRARSPGMLYSPLLASGRSQGAASVGTEVADVTGPPLPFRSLRRAPARCIALALFPSTGFHTEPGRYLARRSCFLPRWVECPLTSRTSFSGIPIQRATRLNRPRDPIHTQRPADSAILGGKSFAIPQARQVIRGIGRILGGSPPQCTNLMDTWNTADLGGQSPQNYHITLFWRIDPEMASEPPTL